MGTGFLGEEARAAAERFQADHKQHAQRLRDAILERGGAAASVADDSSPTLAVLAARIAGVETMHWSVLLGVLGEDPVPVSFVPLPGD